jgi:copper chaperone
MLTFEIKDMTCGHCVSAITEAVESADPGARVQIDLARHRVEVQPVSGDLTRFSEAISAAGYTPTVAETPGDVTVPAKKGGCCCG